MSILENKDLNDYELISFDVVKLYNNCDLQKIKEILLNYIFNRNGRQKLFPEKKDKKSTRKAFATFFDAITRNRTVGKKAKINFFPFTT